MTIDELAQQVADLKKQVRDLSQRRITQEQVVPGAIKQRHVGEGVRFIRSGIAADRPTEGEPTALGSAMYWATDTGVLSIWTGSAWLSETLS